MAFNISRKGCFKCGNRAFLLLPPCNLPSPLPCPFLPFIPFGRFLCCVDTDVLWRQSAILLRTVRRKSGYATTAANQGTNRQRAPSRAASQPSSATRAAASGTSRRNARPSACKARTKNATYAVLPNWLFSAAPCGYENNGLVVFLVGQNCGHFGHIARVCPNEAAAEYGFATRAPPPGRGLNVASLPPVKCYRCGGPNHMARLPGTPICRLGRHERREGPCEDVLQVQKGWSCALRCISFLASS
ncbi:hypothetical protein BJV78DRAFT_385415 [Lactifluus subvellereus]|nr:hypothetical protein BJV78DRAFT_385415 [Lactifluus subvellereus]